MPVVTDDLIVSLHTHRGAQLYQFRPDQYTDCTWTRRQRDASSCDLTVPPDIDVDRLPDIVAWHHWLSVWDGERDTLLWTGPILEAKSNRRGLAIAAKDHGAYLGKTRNPITKRWDAADPSTVAGQLWAGMIAAQGLKTRAIVRPDPEGERFDFEVLQDDQTLDKTIGDLVNLGLRWTVVSGTPIIGPLALDAVETLDEDDFQGDGVTFVRDGRAIVNNVLVRGPDNLGRAGNDYYGQNLQGIANLDDMFGVSNVQRAADRYVQDSGAVKTRLELGAGTVLAPDAPVSIDQLMPGTRLVIEASGIRQLMELTSVEVNRAAGGATVKVTMEQVTPKIELIDVQGQGAPAMTLGGQAFA
jgi:hypothetical protein